METFLFAPSIFFSSLLLRFSEGLSTTATAVKGPVVNKVLRTMRQEEEGDELGRGGPEGRKRRGRYRPLVNKILRTTKRREVEVDEGRKKEIRGMKSE